MNIKGFILGIVALAASSQAACNDYINTDGSLKPFAKINVIVDVVRSNGDQVWFQIKNHDCPQVFFVVDMAWGAEMMRMSNAMILSSLNTQAPITFIGQSIKNVYNGAYSIRVMNITLGASQDVGVSGGIDYLAMPYGAEVTPNAARRISGIRSNGTQTWIQFENQNAKVPTYFIIDNPSGTAAGAEMFKFTNALALYAFQTKTPVRFYHGGLKPGGNTPRVLNLTIGGL